MSAVEATEEAAIRAKRGRTAMRRVRCSRPIALAMAQGIICRESTVFDYGCGHGGDLAYLKARKIKAAGWDPHHRKSGKVKEADVVNLGYVLNVIEDLEERVDTLIDAYRHATKVLLVAVRVDNTLGKSEACGDGMLTGAGTFQKLFSQSEFTSFLQMVLRTRPHPIAPGIAYVFKDEDAEAAYLANKAFARRMEYRTDLIEEFSKSAPAKRLVKLANKLGRLPLPEEFKDYDKLIERFGSQSRIERLTLRHIDREAFDGSKEQRREDLLTYLATLRFQGLKAPKATALPPQVRADVKSIWGSYAAARAESDAFLFSLGDPDAVCRACRGAPFGKLLPTDLYVHRSVEDELPALLRLLLFAAGLIVGDVGYHLAKIALDGRAVSFLTYDGFDEVPHPVLTRSVRVYLPKAAYGVRDYTTYANPPILHRKDLLVAPSYPHFTRFQKLSRQEEKKGLLSGSDIGTRDGWEALLAANKLRLRGHQLVRAS